MTAKELEIGKVICFFDIFDYPLTLLELHKHSSLKIPEIEDILRQDKKISQQNGFYFLNGREKIIEKRFERYNIAEKKFKKRLVFLKMLSCLPFVRAIMICNSLSYLNCPASHDIDIAIIAEEDKIWTARFFVATFLKIFNLRPTKKKKKNKLCPSFFITQKEMSLANLAFGKEDVFLPFWTSQFYPIYQENGTYDSFYQQNSWLPFPNLTKNIPAKRRIIKNGTLKKTFKPIFEKIASILPERLYKKIEYKILPKHLKQTANQNTNVIISDKILKFHDNDKRKEYFNLWQSRLERYSN